MWHIDKSVFRKEGPQKLSGQAKYLDDHVFKNCLYGVTLRSSIARGIIKKIIFDPKFFWKEFVIAGASDIPGKNEIALIENDQPLLAENQVRHQGEPILLLAHPKFEKAYEALDHIHVKYDELPAVLTMEDSSHIFKEFLIKKGDIEKAFREAAFIVEGEYRTPHQEHAYIENNAMAAYLDGDTLVVMGSLQCPYYVHKALKHLLDLPDEKLRVIQTTTGGGFGGKEEYPNMIAGHVALLAIKSKRPVKMLYDRHEDMLATTKRHPAIIRHKTGLTKEGRLLAQDIEIVMDAGAYATLSTVVLSRGALHATGPYECPNVRVTARVVATNTPPNGAFRGFGAPQTLFAAELHWEKIAQVTGMDPIRLRRLNAFREGSVTATGQCLKESVGCRDVLERVIKKSNYYRQRKKNELWNRNKKNPTWRGIGLALTHHGAGFTGSGEVYLKSKAGISINRKGQIKILAASTELGQGATSILAQIVAETLGVPYEWIDVATPDTKIVPDSGPTVASRTSMIVGELVRRSALQLKEELDRKGLKRLLNGDKDRCFIGEYKKPDEVNWDDKTYRGDAYGVYSYGCVAAELEVDKLTYETKVKRLTIAQDIGRAINPVLAQGQVMGGSLQAVGYALLENVVMKDGSMQNAELTNYAIPTFLDAPQMTVEFVEKPYSHGPFGAKGVGELPMNAPAPAIAAAICQATGCFMNELPILPEKIFHAINYQR